MKRKDIIILFDTNFLLLPMHHRVNLLENIEELFCIKPKYCILRTTIEELNKIYRDGGHKDKKMVMLALEIIRNTPIEIINDRDIKGKELDDKIVNFIIKKIKNKSRIIVATNDRELKKRLRKMGVSVLIFREKDYRLWLDGEII